MYTIVFHENQQVISQITSTTRPIREGNKLMYDEGELTDVKRSYIIVEGAFTGDFSQDIGAEKSEEQSVKDRLANTESAIVDILDMWGL